jgi:hypothetical protein
VPLGLPTTPAGMSEPSTDASPTVPATATAGSQGLAAADTPWILAVETPALDAHSRWPNREAAADLLDGWLTPVSARANANDPYYWEGASISSFSSGCFRCASGPAVLAAADAVLNANVNSFNVASAYMTASIRDHQLADGSFTPAAAGETGNDIQTVFFGLSLAETYLLIGDKIGEPTQQQWRAAITSAADFLIRNRNLTWYTNGNISLANAVFMRLTAQITQRADYSALADEALGFVMHPDPTRWPGRGLIYTKAPTLPDGSDGAGYLTETGPGGTGLDTDYLVMQADLASWLYVVSGSGDSLKLLNTLTNQLLTRVNLSSWSLETGGGTRHTDAYRPIEFTSPSLIVLALSGQRPDLRALLDSYVQHVNSYWRQSTQQPSLWLSYALGLQTSLTAYVLGGK